MASSPRTRQLATDDVEPSVGSDRKDNVGFSRQWWERKVLATTPAFNDPFLDFGNNAMKKKANLYEAYLRKSHRPEGHVDEDGEEKKIQFHRDGRWMKQNNNPKK